VSSGSSNTKKNTAKYLLKHGKRCNNCRHYKKNDAGPPIGIYKYCALEANGAGLLSILGKACEKWSLK